MRPENAWFGEFGGRFVPETLATALEELARAYDAARQDAAFGEELSRLLSTFVGRPTPLHFAKRLTERASGAAIYLKREDLNHTGAHKINNALGQALLARRIGKTRVIAETGAGQHGVATATACAMLGMECRVFMGSVDVERQAPNVERMRLLGAEVVPVESGARTLKDAINAAMREWVATARDTHYLVGSVVGPDPYPRMVRDFQSVIGRETLDQFVAAFGREPDVAIACVGGGSNAMGLFHPLLATSTELFGVEAAGDGLGSSRHAASILAGSPGTLHGARTLLLQDRDGQIAEAHSVSAGLDYPGVGPEHAHLAATGRARYVAITDAEALEAFRLLARLEGIVPALESAHAVAFAMTEAARRGKDQRVVVNLSGRGDKDIAHVALSERAREGRGARTAKAIAADPRGGATRAEGTSAVVDAAVVGPRPDAAPSRSLADAFRNAREADEIAFVPYFTAGFPSVAESLDLVEQAVAAGADAVEIGLPFSDPVADGPSIQHSSGVALANGFGAEMFLEALRQRRIGAPVVLMSYLNPLLALGDAAGERLRSAGIRALVVPDLPVDECAGLSAEAANAGIDLALLAASTSSDERLARIGASSRGFVYVVAVTGVTGARREMSRDLDDTLRRARRVTSLPLVAGFGFSEPAHVAELAARDRAPDGVIVGSRLVEAIRAGEDVGALVRSFKTATRRHHAHPHETRV